MLYNLAVINGVAGAEERRDRLAAGMSLADTARAQAMASECMGGDYKDCGS
jgi:hypothetical protein